MIEKAINHYIINDRKFDIRYYIVYGKVKHKIIRSTSVENVITNITQGGAKEKKSFLKTIPRKYLERAERNAVKTAKALNLNLAGILLFLFCSTIIPSALCKNRRPNSYGQV